MIVQGKKILVVEDNEINMEIMTEMLEAVGISVIGAENGQEAIDKLNVANKEDFDVILMDIHMPIMDGYEAAIKIRSMDIPLKNIPIIAITGDGQIEDRRKAREAGMNGFIPKPVSMGLVLEEIERVLG